jgi:hypothetical protein
VPDNQNTSREHVLQCCEASENEIEFKLDKKSTTSSFSLSLFQTLIEKNHFDSQMLRGCLFGGVLQYTSFHISEERKRGKESEREEHMRLNYHLEQEGATYSPRNTSLPSKSHFLG